MHFTRTISLALLALIPACALTEEPDDVASTEHDETASRAPSVAAALTGAGFTRIRTEPVAYVPDATTASEVVCTGDVASGTRRCTERICRGDEARATRICHVVGFEDGRFLAKSSSERFEHPDGRIAWVAGEGARLVGPVRRGAHAFVGKAGASDASVTVTVTDLVMDARGAFRLVADVDRTGPGGAAHEPARELAFDTAAGTFGDGELRAGVDPDRGVLSDVVALFGAERLAPTTATFTPPGGAPEAVRLRWVGRWLLAEKPSTGSPECRPDAGVRIDIEESDPRVRRIVVTASFVTSIRAPDGSVVATFRRREWIAPHTSLRLEAHSLDGIRYRADAPPFAAFTVKDASLVPLHTDSVGEYGWPFYLSSFSPRASCAAARVP